MAAAGDYTLELMAEADSNDCSGGQPDFGWNSDGALGYMLVGTG